MGTTGLELARRGSEEFNGFAYLARYTLLAVGSRRVDVRRDLLLFGLD